MAHLIYIYPNKKWKNKWLFRKKYVFLHETKPIKMKRIWTLAVTMAAAFAGYADTIQVNRFRVAAPLEVKSPYRVDTVDVKAKAFDVDKLLDNQPPFSRLAQEQRWVESLPETQKNQSLWLADFILETQDYVEAEVKVEGLKHYRLYVDEAKNSDGKVKLEPGTHRLALAYLSLLYSKGHGGE